MNPDPTVNPDDSVTLNALIRKIPPHVDTSNHREILRWMDALMSEYYILSEMVIKRDEQIAELKKQIEFLEDERNWDMSPEDIHSN